MSVFLLVETIPYEGSRVLHVSSTIEEARGWIWSVYAPRLESWSDGWIIIQEAIPGMAPVNVQEWKCDRPDPQPSCKLCNDEGILYEEETELNGRLTGMFRDCDCKESAQPEPTARYWHTEGEWR
jgi:hypothetical protein